MLDRRLLDAYAKIWQSHNNEFYKDTDTPAYINGITNCLNGFIEDKAKAAQENTFEELIKDCSDGGALYKGLEEAAPGQRTWAAVFAFGALMQHRKKQLESTSQELPITSTNEINFIEKTTKSLSRGWATWATNKYTIFLQATSRTLITQAINDTLADMKTWINSIEPNQQTEEEFSKTIIAAATLVNLLQTKLKEQKNLINPYLPEAIKDFEEMKKTLMLKQPKLAISILKEDNKENNELLAELFTQDANNNRALKLIQDNPSLIDSLSLIKRIPDKFTQFLAQNSELSLSLINKEDLKTEQKIFIISALLKNKPEYIKILLDNNVSEVKYVLEQDSRLVKSIKEWYGTQEPQEEHAKTSELLHSFNTPIGALSTVRNTLEKIYSEQDIHYPNSLTDKKKRLDIFHKFIEQAKLGILDHTRFQLLYGTEANMNRLCQDLDLSLNSELHANLLNSTQDSFKKANLNSIQGIQAGFVALSNYLINSQWNSIEEIIKSPGLQEQFDNARKYTEVKLNTYNDILPRLKEQIENLDSNLEQDTLEVWMKDKINIMKKVGSDTFSVNELSGQINTIELCLNSYQKELNKIESITQCITELNKTNQITNIETATLSDSMDQYIKALYQQAKILIGEQTQAPETIEEKITLMKEKIQEQIDITKKASDYFKTIETQQK